MKKLFFITILITNSVLAQEFNQEKMDSLFTIIEENDKGMGTFSLFKNGKEVYSKSIGYSFIEDSLKADDNTQYRIGSISKTYIATITMKMIEAGLVDFKRPLSKFFPKIKNAKKITIEHLLRHQSGIFNITSKEDYFDWFDQESTKEKMVQRITEAGSIFKPGEKFEYSNSNYILLGYIAEKIYAKPLSEILQEQIFEPCNCNNTRFGGEIVIENNEAQSYTKMKNWKIATETNMTVPAGAGAISASAYDVSLFFNCLFNRGLVSNSSLDSMTNLKENVGLGLFPIPFHNRVSYGHTGGIDGFSSMAGYFVNDSVSFTYISNGTDFPVNNIIIGALSIYFDMDYTLPEFSPFVVVDSAILKKYVGEYSSEKFPLKITISTEEGVLIAQATGQPSFTLDTVDETTFKFDAAGVKLIFDSENNTMRLLQNGMDIKLTKE